MFLTLPYDVTEFLFSIYLILPALGFTQLLTGMDTRNLSGSKG
jgi:hypothetical protein